MGQDRKPKGVSGRFALEHWASEAEQRHSFNLPFVWLSENNLLPPLAMEDPASLF